MQSYFGHIYIPKENDFLEVEGARLFIDGDIYWIEIPFDLHTTEKYNIVTGAFTGFGIVTLLECTVKKTSMGAGGHEGHLSVKYILQEIQIDNEEGLFFSKLSVKMPALRGWLNKRIFNQVNIFEDKLSLLRHETISFGTFDKFTLEVSFYLNQNLNIETGLSVTDYVTLNIKSNEGNLTLWQFIEIFKKFKKFLAFLGVYDSKDDYFTFYNNEIKFDNQEILVPMKFFMKSYNFKNFGFDFIKTPKFDDISNNIEKVIQNWFSIINLSDSIDLILEKYFQHVLSTDSYFLNSCFAIEIYHRRFKKNERYPKAEFKKIKTNILDKIDDPEVNAFFKEKLAHANEPSFRERLESLQEDFLLVLPGSEEVSSFIKNVVKTRNYIVHRSSSEGTISNLELYYASVYLEALTKLCIYRELGFSQWHILTIFSDTRRKIEGIYNLNKRLQSGINKEISK